MKTFLRQSGKAHMNARTVTVPGALRAVLVTFPPSPNQTGTTKDLFVANPAGTVEINDTAPAGIPDRRVIAIAELVGR
jgi:hypothetical protein